MNSYKPEEQKGLKMEYSTTDHLQKTYTVIEKSTEYNISLHIAFVDYSKVFDSIHLNTIFKDIPSKDQKRHDHGKNTHKERG